MFQRGHFVHTAAQGPYIWLKEKENIQFCCKITNTNSGLRNQIPCGYRVYWRKAQDSCSMEFLWACWPYHSGSPTLGLCRGLRLWWCWFLSGRCSEFSGLDGEYSSRADTKKVTCFLNRLHPRWDSRRLLVNETYLERHCYLDKPLHHLPLRQQFTLLLFQSVIEVTTFTETHHNVQLAVISFPRLSVRHNVGMSQLRQELCLLLCSMSLPLGGGG